MFLCEIKNIDGALKACQEGFKRSILVMHWWGWTSQIINLFGNKINSDLISDVGVDKFKVRMFENFFNVSQIACH